MAGPINGHLGAFLQPSKYGRSSTGNFSVLSYHGDKNSIYGLANAIAQTLGLDYEVTDSFGTSRLDVHYPWNFTSDNAATDIEIKWEFFANQSMKDLLEASVESTMISALSQYQISLIRQLLQNPPTTTQNAMDAKGNAISVPVLSNLAAATFKDPNGNGTDTNGTNAFNAWNLMMQGVKDYPIFQPVIRRTLITSNEYLGVQATLHIKQILSQATLISIEGVPQNALFYNLLPNDTAPPTAKNLAYGWLKLFPTVQEVALRKYQIVQEWQYGLWSTLIWGSPL